MIFTILKAVNDRLILRVFSNPYIPVSGRNLRFYPYMGIFWSENARNLSYFRPERTASPELLKLFCFYKDFTKIAVEFSYSRNKHCLKSIRTRSFSGSYFVPFALNAEV